MKIHPLFDDLDPATPMERTGESQAANHASTLPDELSQQAGNAAQDEDREPESPAMGLPLKQTQQQWQRRSFRRWLLMAPARLLYRGWTRVATRLFPEETHRARLAEQAGIPLPDRLDMSWVTRSLAVGGRVREEDIERLAQSGITRVADTRAEYRDDEAALNRAHIQLLYLPVADTHPLTVGQLMEGTDWVLQQIRDGQKVLIHCEHGVGRSVLLTCATLVRDGYSAGDALRLVQTKRWQASPNHRQITRLHEFEEAVRANARG